MLIRKASANDAGFLKAEIAVTPGRRCPNDNVIKQKKLQDSAGFIDSPREPKISLGWARVARWTVVNQRGTVRQGVWFIFLEFAAFEREKMLLHIS